MDTVSDWWEHCNPSDELMSGQVPRVLQSLSLLTPLCWLGGGVVIHYPSLAACLHTSSVMFDGAEAQQPGIEPRCTQEHTGLFHFPTWVFLKLSISPLSVLRRKNVVLQVGGKPV